MKRIGYLYEKIWKSENLKLAIIEAYKKQEVPSSRAKWMRENLDEAVAEIQKNPHFDGQYVMRKHYDKSCQKWREICVPTFRDLVIQHALIQVISPVLRRGEYRYSCACIKGKGSLNASMSLRKMIVRYRDKRAYYFKMDISKYFPNVKCKILYAKIEKVIKDRKCLEFIKELLIAYENGEKGLPIGWYTSQIFANFNLNDVDHYIKEQLGVDDYVRYMDDMHFLGSNKRQLRKSLLLIRKYLKEQLGLNTHILKEFVVEYRDDNFIDLCGYRHYKSHTTIRRRVFTRTVRTFNRLKKWISPSRARRAMSYLGYIKHSNSRYLYKALKIDELLPKLRRTIAWNS